MPEHVFVDMDPGVTSVPASTWKRSTAKGVRSILEEFSIHPHPEQLSTLALAESVWLQPIVGEERELLAEIAPELLEELDEDFTQQASQQNAYRRDHNIELLSTD